MNKGSRAGIKAGAITGFLFLPFLFLILSVVSGISVWDVARYISQMSIVTRLRFSVEEVLIFMLIGFVFLGVLFGVLGLILGIVFAKSERKLPTKSVYVKAVIFGCILFVLTFFVHWAFDPWILLTILADSMIFAALFNRWMKTPHHNQMSDMSRTSSSSIAEYCTQCGVRIRNANDKFCSECGKAL